MQLLISANYLSVKLSFVWNLFIIKNIDYMYIDIMELIITRSAASFQ